MPKEKSTPASSGARSYGHYCGIAYALDVVGDRWTLLIARELLLGPRRYTDLVSGLPAIASNLLTTRLRELERAGILVRYRLPPPAASTVYELTELGRGLQEPIMALGRFGAKFMALPRPGDVVKPRWFVLGMLCAFDPATAPPLPKRTELRLDDEVVTFEVEGAGTGRASVNARQGPAHDPDLTLTTRLERLAPLLFGQATPLQALERGDVRVEGSPEQFSQFISAFELTRLLAPGRLTAGTGQ